MARQSLRGHLQLAEKQLERLESHDLSNSDL